MTDKRVQTGKYIFMLLIIIVPLFSSGLSNHGLWSPDEPRVAEIGREMAVTGNWAVPTLNQKPFLEQPPLYYAALALTFRVFGISDKVARIPSAFFAFATILVVFFMANFFFGSRVAFLAGVILATAGEFIRVAHWAVVDGALTFFIVSTLCFFIRGYLSGANKEKLFWYSLFYIACSFAFYTKGFIGVAIPGISVLLFLIIERNFREIIRMRLWLGALIFLIMTLPWFIALWQQGGGEYFSEFFIHNHLQRFFPSSIAGDLSNSVPSHHRPFYYYITEFPNGFLPWSILLVPVFFHAFSKSGKSDIIDVPSEKGTLLLKCWFLGVIVFLSIASTKRTLYLMPIFAPIAMMTAVYIDFTLKFPQSITRTGKIFTWLYTVFMLFVGFVPVPAYLFMQKHYPSYISESALVPIVALSMVVTIFSCLAVRYFYRKDLIKYWISMIVSIISTLLFVLLFAMPVVDAHNSFALFCKQIAPAVPAGEPLYAYRPNETMRGSVPFYTGRYVIEMEDLGDVEAMFQKEKPFYLIIRDKRERMEKKLLSTGRIFTLVKQELTGTDHTLVLLSNKSSKRQQP